MKILTKEAYDIRAESLRGIPNDRPVAVKAEDLRALLRAIDTSKLPEEPKEDA